MEAQKKILLVDDDAGMRQTLAGILQGAGYDVIAASSVDEAVTALCGHRDIALVLCDYHLRGHSPGTDVSKWMRENSYNVPFVLMSGDPETAKFTRMVQENTIHAFLDAKEDRKKLFGILENLLGSPQRAEVAPRNRAG